MGGILTVKSTDHRPKKGISLFVAIATGQNIANLPPILEFAERRDRVVFLVSEWAKSNPGHLGSAKVLSQHHLTVFPDIAVPDISNPEILYKTSIEKLDKLIRKHPELENVYLVTNGGPKPSMLGLYPLLRGSLMEGRRARLLYGQQPACEVWEIDARMSVSKHPYRKGLGLKDIMLCNQMDFFKNASSPPICFWSSDRSKIVSPLPPGKYPQEGEEIYRYHQLAFEHLAYEAYAAYRPAYERAQDFFGDRFSDWRKSLWEMLQSSSGRWFPSESRQLLLESFNLFRVPIEIGIEASDIERIHPPLQMLAQNARASLEKGSAHIPETHLSSFYQYLGKAVEQMATHAIKQKSPFVLAGLSPLGPQFELAVARRVYDWLTQHGADCCINEAWLNVAVVTKTNPKKTYAEFDILLVVQNGILLHLECKAGHVTPKEMNSRENTLHHFASQIATQKIVTPVYTHCQNSDWFLRHDRFLWQPFQEMQPELLLPFTLPGQPGFYLRNHEKKQPEKVKIPAFEDSLFKWLARYRPSQSKGEGLTGT